MRAKEETMVTCDEARGSEKGMGATAGRTCLVDSWHEAADGFQGLTGYTGKWP